jgi:hypothetical protein
LTTARETRAAALASLAVAQEREEIDIGESLAASATNALTPSITRWACGIRVFGCRFKLLSKKDQHLTDVAISRVPRYLPSLQSLFS